MGHMAHSSRVSKAQLPRATGDAHLETAKCITNLERTSCDPNMMNTKVEKRAADGNTQGCLGYPHSVVCEPGLLRADSSEGQGSRSTLPKVLAKQPPLVTLYLLCGRRKRPFLSGELIIVSGKV